MSLKAEEFVKIWQSSKTIDEAAKKAKVTKIYASYKAHMLRKKGIALKKFGSGAGKLNIKELQKICEESKKERSK